MTVNILGTPYTVVVKKYSEDEVFDRCSFAGYCDPHTHSIVLCDMHTYKGWEHEAEETVSVCHKSNLRHEIVHAFFNESGLQDDCYSIDKSWAKNEEMVDWFAIQGPKIYAAWQAAGAL